MLDNLVGKERNIYLRLEGKLPLFSVAEVVYKKSAFLKISQNSKENSCVEVYLDSSIPIQKTFRNWQLPELLFKLLIT